MNEEAIEKIKQTLERSLGTHIRWLEFYRQNPERETEYEEIAGNKKHQEDCIGRYEEALKALALLQKPCEQPKKEKL